MTVDPTRPSVPSPGNSRQAPEREAPDHAPHGTWIVLVREGIVSQAYPAPDVEDALKKLVGALPTVQIYAVKSGQTPPPAPGSPVDPVGLGWAPLAVPGPGAERPLV